ncbi:MAG: putative ABC transport system permease protein [Gammaproteobacteria bacterium]|jgi:putative ABC transport system permease protein
MRSIDILHFNTQVFTRHRWRTVMLAFCIVLGVSSVVLLTSLGESARRYVQREFAMLGNDLLIILPGKKQTSGGGVPMYGTSPRDLTLTDAQHIARLAAVKSVAPIIAGNGAASYKSRNRDVIVVGSTAGFLQARKLTLAMGRGLPADAQSIARPVAVIGSKLKNELFAGQNPLGKMLTIDDYRYQVIGVLAERGESLGLDMRDMVILPVLSAEALFDTPALFRILVELHAVSDRQSVIEQIYQIIKQRHQNEEDITIITQQSIMQAFNNILLTLTAIIGLLAAISLVVAGILIMNLSLISVQQRRTEIGLLKALGASSKLIQQIFVWESVMLVAAASIIGLMSAQVIIFVANQWLPILEFVAPLWSHAVALGVALFTSLVFSWLPARKAAMVSPIEVLRG